MIPPKLEIDDIPGWCEQNGVEVRGLTLAHMGDIGIGWIAQQDLKNSLEDDEPGQPLLVVPKDVIISARTAIEYAPKCALFHELLAAVKFQEERQLVLLYMLMQYVLSSERHRQEAKVAPEAWMSYIGIQPQDVPVPTPWSSAELALLKGTSLESAVAAKKTMLEREWTTITTEMQHIPFWREVFETDFHLRDWTWLDALFRSRSFDLPYSGESMIPCLDLVNHSSTSNAYFQQDPETETVTLVLREGCSVEASLEVCISYGNDKPAAEMLYNYGFVDTSSKEQSLIYPLDDYLKEIEGQPDATELMLEKKLRAFNAVPTLELKIDENGQGRWSAPFALLMFVSEKQGLAFKVEERQGQQSQRMLWQGKDITYMAGMFDVFLNTLDTFLRESIRSLAVYTVMTIATGKLREMQALLAGEGSEEKFDQRIWQAAMELRRIEMGILESCQESLTAEYNRKANLLLSWLDSPREDTR